MKDWILKVVVVAVAVLVVLLVFYFVASPYQNCYREVESVRCIEQTAW
jgi:hypothetical protein